MKNIVLSTSVLLLAACASQAQPVPTPEKASESMNMPTSAASNNLDHNHIFSETAKPLKQLLRFPREGISAINFYIEDDHLLTDDKGSFWTHQKWIEHLRYPSTKNNPTGWSKSEYEYLNGRFGWFRTPAEQWPKILDQLEEVQTSSSRQLHPNDTPALLIEIQYLHREPVYILVHAKNPYNHHVTGNIHGLTPDNYHEQHTSPSQVFFGLEDIRKLFKLVDNTYPLFR